MRFSAEAANHGRNCWAIIPSLHIAIELPAPAACTPSLSLLITVPSVSRDLLMAAPCAGGQHGAAGGRALVGWRAAWVAAAHHCLLNRP